MSQKKIIAGTDLGKNSVSRVVRMFDEYEIITVTRKGRENVIELNEDWMETVAALTPSMTTYGNKDRREFGISDRAVRDLDRRIAMGKGDVERLRLRRENAAATMMAIAEKDLAGYAEETRSAMMRRMLRHDSLRRNAALEDKAVVNLDKHSMAAAGVQTWKNETTSIGANLRMNAIMTELEENQMVIDAREALKLAELVTTVVVPVVVTDPDRQVEFSFN